MREKFPFLFNPKSVAVIGATDNPGKLGYHVLKSLLQGGYGGEVFPVNPTKVEILGVRTYSSINEIPSHVDLAIIVVPASKVLSQIKACSSKDIKGIVLITAGFREIDDPHGAELEDEVARAATSASIPVIGPNTFGFVNLHASLNATFTPEFSRLKRGLISFVSQSGGISHLLGFLAMRMDLGFSKIVGLGNRCNVDFAHMIRWLADDTQTKVIALYLEGLDYPGDLLLEARLIRGRKPVVVYKAGKGEVADRASLSHTGSLAGRYELYQGAFRQAGMLSVDSMEELLDAAKVLGSCPPLTGENVAILSGQAGPALAASDVCEKEGLRLGTFSQDTQRTIMQLLPPLAIRTNPVDMGPAWHDAGAIGGVVEAVLRDEGIHGVLLLIMFASANAEAVEGLRVVLERVRPSKPVITCISAPPGIWDGQVRHMEEENLIANFPTPERAARAMGKLLRMKRIQAPE
jgi:acyl-CoA synthetase (NDP forming)